MCSAQARPTIKDVTLTVYREWQVQEAKRRLSALIAEAQHAGPQSITRYGRPVAILLSPDDFERLSTRPKTSLFEFLTSAPRGELNIPERDRHDFGREMEL